MRPFYFGAADKPLFGVYSPPADGSPPRGAVVLCYPFGAEYLRSHRAMRELSHNLTEMGYHTLRFDYFGCGDSSGSGEQGSVAQWLEDIAFGVQEMRDASGTERISLLGLRFGAALAALAGSRGLMIDRLVLWDPIVNGRTYLDELAARHRTMMLGRPLPRGWQESEPPDELLGTPMPTSLREGIAALDLLALPRSPARSVLLVGTGSSSALAALQEHLSALGQATDHRHISSPPLWLAQDDVDRTLVPHDIIECIAGWLGGSAA